MNNRIISLILAICMIVSAVPTYVGAVETASVAAGDITAYPGNSVTVTVRADRLESLASMDLYIYYDPSVLTVSNAYAAGWISGEFVSVNVDVPGEVRFSLISLNGISGSGNLLYINFSIPNDCPTGTYPIHVAVGEAYDVGLEAVQISADSGSITVNEASKEYFYLNSYLDDYTVSKSDFVTFQLYNNYSRSFACADFVVHYDPEYLQVENVELHSQLKTGNGICDVNTNVPGTIHISYISTEAVNPYNLVNIRFSVIADVDAGTTISAEVRESYNADLIPYHPASTMQNLTLEKLPQAVDYKDFTLIANPMIVGLESDATIVLEAGSPVAAGDFSVYYDPAVIQIVSVSTGLADTGDMNPSGTVVINDNFTDGRICFSYVNLAGDSATDLPLIHIRWIPLLSPEDHCHITMSGSMVVDTDQNTVTLDYNPYSNCIFTPQVITDSENHRDYTVYPCNCGEYYVADCSHGDGHSYSTVTIPATCSAVGYILASCQHCNGTYLSEILPALPHNYQSVVTPPTCTEEGYTTHTCLECGETYLDSYEDALGHSMGSWYDITEETCTESHQEQRDCSACDFFEVRTVEPIGHVIGSWIADGATNTTTRYCENCDYSETVDHYILASGVCGESVEWYLTQEGELVILGSGAMTDFTSDSFPWYDYRNQILSVSMSDEITAISDYAFYYCSYIKSVDLPDHLIRIGERAFGYCSALTSLRIPEHVSEIESNPFRRCYGLREIEFTGNAPNISSNGFLSVTATVYYPYDDSTWTDEVKQNYGGTLTWIGVCDAHEFGDWYTVVEPDCLNTGIQKRDCIHCEYSESGVIEANGHSFGEWYETITPNCTDSGEKQRDCIACDYYETEMIPANGHKMENGVCVACGIPDGAIASGQCGDHLYWNLYDDGNLLIYGTGDMYSYSSRNQPWLPYADQIMTLEVWPGATSIGNSAFSDSFDALTTVTLPAGLLAIEDYAFKECNNLSVVTLQDGLETIGSQVFWNCGALQSIEIPETVNYIGSFCFALCYNLEYANIPEGVTSLGTMVFFACYDLKEIVLPESLTYIGNSAFASCTSLTEIVIPSNVTSIADTAFDGCRSMKEAWVPATVTHIGNDAFHINTLIHCHSDSAALTYALDNGNPYCETPAGQPLGHTYSVNITSPTCTAEGYSEYSCSKCGYGFVSDYLPATGHAWGNPAYTVNKDGTHTATYTCNHDPSHTRSDPPELHIYTDGKCVCGAIWVSVTALGNVDYTVEGQTVTVTHDKPIRAGYWDADAGKYVAIQATANTDGSYTFTAPAGVTHLLLVVLGDVNGDERVSAPDVARINAYLHGKINLTAEEVFIADVNCDGQVNESDITYLTNWILGRSI